MSNLSSAAWLLLASVAAVPPLAAQEATAAGLTVARDPQTGRLRAANAAELAALLQRQDMLRAAPLRPQQKWHASGARGARLSDEFISMSVAVRAADGTLSRQCFDSRAQAEAVLGKAPAGYEKE